MYDDAILRQKWRAARVWLNERKRRIIAPGNRAKVSWVAGPDDVKKAIRRERRRQCGT